MLQPYFQAPARPCAALLACALFTGTLWAQRPVDPAPGAPLPSRPAPGAPAINSLDPNAAPKPAHDAHGPVDYWSMLFVLVLATFIGVGVIRRVSRLLHTPLMSITNAISAIAVVGAIIVAGADRADYPLGIRILGAVALFASMTNIVSGFLITDRMLKMFKQPGEGRKS